MFLFFSLFYLQTKQHIFSFTFLLKIIFYLKTNFFSIFFYKNHTFFHKIFSIKKKKFFFFLLKFFYPFRTGFVAIRVSRENWIPLSNSNRPKLSNTLVMVYNWCVFWVEFCVLFFCICPCIVQMVSMSYKIHILYLWVSNWKMWVSFSAHISLSLSPSLFLSQSIEMQSRHIVVDSGYDN